MLQVEVQVIEPDESTLYLVGPEGLVWVQPAIGDAHIVAARNEAEQTAAAGYIGALLDMGLVPYGLSLNHRAVVAMFGGPVLRDCEWIPWQDAPEPRGDDDTLPLALGPEHAAVVVLEA